MPASTIIDYVETELRPFSALPPNAVDSLVFSQLAYLRLAEAFPETAGAEGVALRGLWYAEHEKALFGGMRDEKENRRLLAGLAASPRFRTVAACAAVNQVDAAVEKQFAAVTFRLPDAGTFVAFRGTDSSLTGWKEDFNLAVRYPVPSQEEAVRYLGAQALQTKGALYVGGHSKGGNLAVYAVARADDEVGGRIVRVFDHDGPGFPATVARTPKFSAVADLVDKTVPEDSVVGMILSSAGARRVVRSTATGVLQHGPFTWEVDLAADDFAAGRQSLYSQYAERSLAGWIASMDPGERQRFVDALFEVLSGTGSELPPGGIGAAALGRAVADADPDDGATLGDAFGKLARTAVSVPLEQAQQMVAEHGRPANAPRFTVIHADAPRRRKHEGGVEGERPDHGDE